jgi:hypothetical protein
MKDITGQRFGKLVVLKVDHLDLRRRSWWWHCKCDCGSTCIIDGHSLRSGNTQSCGCLRLERLSEKLFVHGKSKDPLYDVWIALKARCLDSNNTNFVHYGGRGITVCDDWLEFVPFQDWALDSGYKKGLSIDRIDNNKGYYPENCRWVSHKVNNRNKRNNHLVTYKGETKIVTVWAESLNMPPSVLMHRLNQYKWSVEKAIETPYKPKGPYNIKKKKV